MSYEEKIKRAETVVAEHNCKVKELHPLTEHISWENFHDALICAGGTSDLALRECSWEDLVKMTLPLLLAKIVAKIFRESDSVRLKSTENAPEIPPKLSEDEESAARELLCQHEELLCHYDPDRQNIAFQKLSELSKGLPCIVYSCSGWIDREASARNINLITRDKETEISHEFNGIHIKLYKIGEKPEQRVEAK